MLCQIDIYRLTPSWSDMRSPGHNGACFLEQIRSLSFNLIHQLSLLRTSNALNLNDFSEHVELIVWVIRFHSK